MKAPLSERSAQWLTLGAAFAGLALDGVELGIFPIIARPALQEMLAVHGDQQIGIWMGRLTAFFLIGAAGGGLVFGWMGDKFGRVRAMALSVLVYSLFTGACYFASAPWHLAAFRFISALGLGGQWSLGVALVMETWPERHRGWLAGVVGAGMNFGMALTGVLAFYVHVTVTSWRWIMLVGTLPALLTFLIRLYVPESARWAASVGQSTASPVREIFMPPHRRNTLIAIALASVVLIGTWGCVQWIPLWVDKLTGGADPGAKALVSILISAGAVVGCFIGSSCGGLGRRPAYFILCLLSFAVCTCLFRGIDSYHAPFLILAFLVGTLASSFYGWLPLYLPELFPTRIRATAQGVSYNFGRILAAVGALGAGQLVNYYEGSYARMGAAITFVYLAGAVAIWWAPETKGKPLPL